MSTERFEHLLTTAKQRAFDRDFLARWHEIEFWDTLQVGEPQRHPETFVVEEEDVLAYNLAVGETHPLYIDPAYARDHAPRKTVLAHPVFTTTIAFWFAQPDTQGSWIRTPGSRNPFQRIEYRERIHVGDRLSMIQENSDRFWRRDKSYVTTRLTIIDQDENIKAICDGTLILPPTRDEVACYVNA
jgi:acyl dehydratase